jgi:hypothetical protein
MYSLANNLLKTITMKNVFFALALLVGTFAFANTNESMDKFSEISFEKLAFENSKDYTFSFNENLISDSQLLALKDCVLRGKGSVTLRDGSTFTWEVTITVVGQSCVEFLKELMGF